MEIPLTYENPDRLKHDLDKSPLRVGPIHFSMTLNEVENAIRRESHEHLVVWHEGRQIYRRKGTKSGVAIPPSQKKLWNELQDCVATHNHPNGVCFSPEDILCAVGGDLAEIRAVSPNGGVFVFTRPEQGWGTAEGLDGPQVVQFVQLTYINAQEATQSTNGTGSLPTSSSTSSTEPSKPKDSSGRLSIKGSDIILSQVTALDSEFPPRFRPAPSTTPVEAAESQTLEDSPTI